MSFVTLAPADAQTRTAAQAERDRRAEADRAARLRGQAEVAQREVGELDTRLVVSGQRRAAAEAAAALAEERLAALRAQIQSDAERQIHARRAFEAALVVAAFAERRAEPRVVRVGIFARAAAPSLAAVENDSARALLDARRLEVAIAEEQRALAEAEAAIDAERSELAALMERRRAAQAHYAAGAAAAERRAVQLAAEARNLRELAQRASAAAGRGAAAPGPSVIPAGWQPPVEGRIARAFGARSGEGPPAQGVALRTRGGAQVVAPATGEVTYAGPFRSYGQVLILSLDGGYALVLTGLGQINARVGDTVRAGQPVGEMPVSDTPSPELYVEVRRNGEPVDPGRWLGARSDAAGRVASAG